ncbi:DUF4214 domain-containing protein [Pigmentiphaga aceris]|nr:DUF4214 domain-containing protein [Pigmentiphaga aceris]
MAQPTDLDIASITRLYVGYFGRTPDSAGLTFWATALADGASLESISQSFLLAPEGEARYPATQSATAFVEAFYESTFGRAADADGLAFWLAVLEAAGGVESTAARTLLVSKITDLITAPLPDDLPADSQAALDRALFANKVEYSVYVATKTDLTGPDAPAGNFSLTKITADPTSVTEQKTAADTAQSNGTPIGQTPTTGGGATTPDQPLTFTRTYAQLSAPGASVVGGTASDTLWLTTDQDVTGTPANVQNVERIGIYTSLGVEVISVNTARFVGAQNFIVGSTADVFFTGLAAGQTGLVDSKNFGGNNIANGHTSFAYAEGVTSGAVTVSRGVTAGKVSITGESLSSVTLTSNGFAANKLSGLALSDQVTTLTINALSSFAVGSAPLTGGASHDLAVIVTGAGRVDLGLNSAFLNANINSLDATGNTGGVVGRVSGQVGQITTVLGGSGHDDIRLTTNTTFIAGSVIDLGAGNDYVGGSGAIFGSGVTVDGGDGFDSVSAYAMTATNAAAFVNFERVSVAGDQVGNAKTVDLDWVVNSEIGSLGLGGGDSAGGVTAIHVDLTQALNVTGTTAGGVTTLVFRDVSGENDGYSIVFNPTTPSSVALNAGTVSVEGVETLNLNSGSTTGNTTEIAIADAALQTLNIAGSFPIKVSFTTETTATSLIDASGLTGSLVLDTSNLVADAEVGLTVTGSATAANYLSIAQRAFVSGGSGADIFLLKSSLQLADSADESIDANLVSITNFGQGDQINVGNILGSTGTTLFSYTTSNGQTISSAAIAAIATAAAQGTAAQEFATFQLDGNTYVAADINSDGTFDAGDVVVELIGLINLSNVFVNVAQGTLTNNLALPSNIVLPPQMA